MRRNGSNPRICSDYNPNLETIEDNDVDVEDDNDSGRINPRIFSEYNPNLETIMDNDDDDDNDDEDDDDDFLPEGDNRPPPPQVIRFDNTRRTIIHVPRAQQQLHNIPINTAFDDMPLYAFSGIDTSRAPAESRERDIIVRKNRDFGIPNIYLYKNSTRRVLSVMNDERLIQEKGNVEWKCDNFKAAMEVFKRKAEENRNSPMEYGAYSTAAHEARRRLILETQYLNGITAYYYCKVTEFE